MTLNTTMTSSLSFFSFLLPLLASEDEKSNNKNDSWDFFLWPLGGKRKKTLWPLLLQEITGFTGSSGFYCLKNPFSPHSPSHNVKDLDILEVSKNLEHYLVTDSRYTLQAQEETSHCPSLFLQEGSWCLGNIKNILDKYFLFPPSEHEKKKKPKLLLHPGSLSLLMAKHLDSLGSLCWISSENQHILESFLYEKYKPSSSECCKKPSKTLEFLHDTFSFSERCEKIWPQDSLCFPHQFHKDSNKDSKKEFSLKFSSESFSEICFQKSSSFGLFLENSWDIFWLLGLRYHHYFFSSSPKEKLPFEVPLTQEDPLQEALGFLCCFPQEEDPQKKWHFIFCFPSGSCSKENYEEALKKSHYHCVHHHSMTFCSKEDVFYKKVENFMKQSSGILYVDAKETTQECLNSLRSFLDQQEEKSEKSLCSESSSPQPLSSNISIQESLLQPLHQQRCLKSPQEQGGMIWAGWQDSRALISFLYWLFHEAILDKETEYSLVQQLEKKRWSFPGYRGQSFPTISAFGPHSAFVHYKTPEHHSTPLSQGPYLLDTGGHYCSFSRSLYGTTDISRSFWLGPFSSVPQKYKEHYTRVLMAHIRGVQGLFPPSFSTKALDGLTRKILWDHGEDYGHATSHGVGAYGPVHEYPPTVSPRDQGILKESMVLSHEPGYYEESWGGLRLENLFLVQQKHYKETSKKEEECFSKSPQRSSWLFLKPLTFVPFDLKSILFQYLSPSDKQWLLAYYDTMISLANNDENLSSLEKKWLLEEEKFLKLS